MKSPSHSNTGIIGVAILLLVVVAVIGGLFYFGVMKGNLLKTTDPSLNTTNTFDQELQQTVTATPFPQIMKKQ